MYINHSYVYVTHFSYIRSVIREGTQTVHGNDSITEWIYILRRLEANLHPGESQHERYLHERDCKKKDNRYDRWAGVYGLAGLTAGSCSIRVRSDRN
jgi:hypothetical protein